MTRRLWLLVPLALGLAGCIVVVQAPATPTRSPLFVPTATLPASVTPPVLSTAVNIATATPPATATAVPPAGDLGWQSIRGTVRRAESNQPLPGASVGYSHFSYLHPSRQLTITAGAAGEYAFDPIQLHDTDVVRVRAEAPGYLPAEVERSGLDAFRDPVFDFSLEVTVPATAPVSASLSITSFAVSPETIRPGEPLTLTWEVAAETVTLWQLDPQGRLSISYSVPISGALVITPSETLRNHVDFLLFAGAGASSAQAFVSATILCPDVWFFTNPPASCPGSAHVTPMAAEHFERGLMLWTEWNNLIYILYSDQIVSPRWEARPNVWTQGMPESDPAIVPPPGAYQPVRGFGAAWRDEQAPPGARVRDRVGWATDEEFSISGAVFQCDTAPKYNTCFITGPSGVVLALLPERSDWRVWTGP